MRSTPPPHCMNPSWKQTEVKTVIWYCNIDASIGAINGNQNAVDLRGRHEAKGGQFWLEPSTGLSNSFYSLLAKKAELREADIAHKYYQCIF